MNLAGIVQGYFQAYLFWLGLPLGALFFLALHKLTGGRWGQDLALPLRSSARTLPMMALLFVPLLFVLKEIYPWVQAPESRGHSFHPEYLSSKWFAIRAIFYFGLWLALSAPLLKPSSRGEPAPRGLPAGAIILLFLSVSFAAVDWTMSLTEGWFSSVYGLIILTGSGLSALAAAVWAAAPTGPRPSTAQGDLATLLFVTLIACAYAHFSQLIIVWSGNEPSEMRWYLARYSGPWRFISWSIVAFGFGLPFLLLLFRRIKRDHRRAGGIAALIMLGQALTNYWLVVPSLKRGERPVQLVDAAWLAAIGAVWFALYARSRRRLEGGRYA